MLIDILDKVNFDYLVDSKELMYRKIANDKLAKKLILSL